MSVDYPQLRHTVLDTTDPRGLAEFYRQLLGYKYRPGHETLTADGDDWLVLRHPEGHCGLAFQRVDSLTPSTWPDDTIPQQLHLDLTVPDKAELDRQHERAMTLGARLLLDGSDDEEEAIRVYADPAGHPFCIFTAPPPGTT